MPFREAVKRASAFLRHRWLTIPALLVWIAAVAVGGRALIRYEATPGRLASPPVIWPQASRIRPETKAATLLVFAHPRCPCSRATMEELALLMAHCAKKVGARVIFYAPPSEGAKWATTDLWRSAAIIPGVRVLKDPDGEEARRFGASTSGQTLLYDLNGHLMFNGGITAGRGHIGPNGGWDAILSLLDRGTPPRNTTAVFGCPLVRPK